MPGLVQLDRVGQEILENIRDYRNDTARERHRNSIIDQELQRLEQQNAGDQQDEELQIGFEDIQRIQREEAPQDEARPQKEEEQRQ